MKYENNYLSKSTEKYWVKDKSNSSFIFSLTNNDKFEILD